MGVPTVVVWACLAVFLVTADDTLPSQPLPLPLLMAQGHSKPHYILTDTLKPKFLGNSVQDLDASEDTIKGGVPGPLLYTPQGKPPSDTQAHVPLTHLTPLGEEGATNRMLWRRSRQRRMYPVSTPRRKNSKKPHTRQKRYTLKYKIRSIAVPLSVFNFLGFLPVRVPGLPYHNDLPSPDYTHYNTKYDVYLPRYRRRKTFRRF